MELEQRRTSPSKTRRDVVVLGLWFGYRVAQCLNFLLKNQGYCPVIVLLFQMVPWLLRWLLSSVFSIFFSFSMNLFGRKCDAARGGEIKPHDHPYRVSIWMSRIGNSSIFPMRKKEKEKIIYIQEFFYFLPNYTTWY